MKFRILGAAVVLALAAMPSKARQPQPIPAPQPAISTYCATMNREIPSVRSTTIRPGVRGGQKAIGTVVATMPALVISLFAARDPDF